MMLVFVKSGSLRDNILALIFTLMAVRPVIDLFGRFEGEGINAGGILGFVVAGMIVVLTLVSEVKLSRALILSILAFGFLASLGLSHLIFSDQKSAVLLSLSRFIIGFSPILLFGVIKRNNQDSMKGLIRSFYYILLVSSLVPITIAWLQFLGFFPFTYFDYLNGMLVGRPSGGYHQPNSLARLLIFIVFFTYMIFLKNGKLEWNKYLIISLVTATTFITTHRTSFLILILLILGYEIYLFLRRKTINLSYLGSLLICCVIIISIISAYFYYLGSSASHFSFNTIRDTYAIIAMGFNTIAEESISGDRFLRGRGWRWQRTIDYMQQEDLFTRLFGLGHAPYESHMDFLNIYFIFGLIGLASWVVLHLGVFSWLWTRSRVIGRFSILMAYYYLLLYSIPLQPIDYPYFMWLFFVSLIISWVYYSNFSITNEKFPIFSKSGFSKEEKSTNAV